METTVCVMWGDIWAIVGVAGVLELLRYVPLMHCFFSYFCFGFGWLGFLVG